MGRVGMLLLGLWWIASAIAEVQIEAHALFKGRALLSINGKSQVVKSGESVAGVQLISATPASAVVEVNGERRILELRTNIAGGYAKPEAKSVAITKNNRLEYRVPGTVNGRNVDFLVDTGANVVAFSAVEAKRLGIDFERGTPSLAETASGVVNAWRITLDKVTVGGINASNVAASVLEGDHPKVALLGMSWLQHVNLREQEGILYLDARY